MDNVKTLKINPYHHLKHFFGEKFLIVSLNPIEGASEASYVMGNDISVEDMAFICKIVQMMGDEFIQNNMGV